MIQLFAKFIKVMCRELSHLKNVDILVKVWLITCLYLIVDDQLCANSGYVTATADKKRNFLFPDIKERGGKSALGSVSLNFSGRCLFRGSVLVSPNPPVPLLIGRLSSVPSCWVITIGRLVVKRCTSLIPAIDSIFEIELACFQKSKE